ncbi:MAG: DUF4259 domain-containing protein [Propionibacteriaceae bacterium]|jgi:hypothetical protein|nr:DUF4259 domain-containing protein [Propionibacteriaceae bacterium]
MSIGGWDWSEEDGWPFEGDEAIDFMDCLVMTAKREDHALMDSLMKAPLSTAVGKDGFLDVGSGEAVVVIAALLDSKLNGTAYGYGRRLRSDKDGPGVSDAEVYARWVELLWFPWVKSRAELAVAALGRVLGADSGLAQSRDQVWRGRMEELRARLSR